MDTPLDWLLLAVHTGLVLLVAPLLNGLIKSVKAALQNRRGPSILQPAFDIVKYLGRESVVSEHASWIFHAVPYVSFGAYLTAAALVPTILVRPPLAAFGDVVVVVGLLALARFALALAALDTASNFGGMGTSRELAFAALVEPALLLGLFAVALPAGSTALAAIAGTAHPSASLLLAFGALFVVAIAETGRIPIDNPDTHLELTMAHEGMLLEYSGRPLGLLIWGAQVKQAVVLSLLAALFAPLGLASEAAPAALAVGLGLWLAKLSLFGVLLALVETSLPKLRVFRIPDLLGAASLLAMLAVIARYTVGG
ncbi:MAG: NADH-quinone oxidoreductase subunit H [Chloroflexi bacterium]|nr:NADH-quinone oxidoreductase subunit H [Chloroflexota bacterium]